MSAPVAMGFGRVLLREDSGTGFPLTGNERLSLMVPMRLVSTRFAARESGRDADRGASIPCINFAARVNRGFVPSRRTVARLRAMEPQQGTAGFLSVHRVM